MKKIILPFILLTGFMFSQQIKFEEYDLSNGLHVILHKDNSNPVVAISVSYHVGSKNEKPDRTGFAHFFEHLLFEGSENIKRGEFFQYINKAGGQNNANTKQDRTYYYEILPSNQLGLGLWLESERMLHAKVDKEGIETQRKVVKEEKRLRIDNQPYSDAITRILWNDLFPTHPYHWSVIGSMEDLDAASEEDYVHFYKTFYVPDNAVLTIAGDIDLDQAKKMINDYFGSIPRGKEKIIRPAIEEKPITKEIIVDAEDKNAQVPALILGYRTPKQTDKDAYVLTIIGNILSNGESSRIVKNVQNKKQLAMYTGSFLWPLEDYGVFLVLGLTNLGVTIDQLGGAIDEEIENLKKNGITQKELDIQINKLEKDFIDANSTVEGVAESLSDYYLFYHDTNLINSAIEIYRSITIDDVKRVANQYLNENQRVRLTVMPEKKP
ncbi:M16 family metallopeptidase [Apibacter adventoris]|uniref:Insulinase family protein n=1 Tax=Apibacter adventoris TaxID=1679466 RepID=A0A2S8A7G7_9FLAO|nr:pitrilysin family protein [Apibacter adventoris]PQL90514.1 insulinase family protein [Apibacter adventoris]